jgi:hypothetical protein
LKIIDSIEESSLFEIFFTRGREFEKTKWGLLYGEIEVTKADPGRKEDTKKQRCKDTKNRKGRFRWPEGRPRGTASVRP